MRNPFGKGRSWRENLTQAEVVVVHPARLKEGAVPVVKEAGRVANAPAAVASVAAGLERAGGAGVLPPVVAAKARLAAAGQADGEEHRAEAAEGPNADGNPHPAGSRAIEEWPRKVRQNSAALA
jgi:hypothetical protein